MDPILDNAAGVVATGTDVTLESVTVAPATVAQPDFKGLANEWKTRSIGWQNKFQAEQEERKNIEKALKELQDKHSSVNDSNNSLSEQLKTLQEKEATVTTELGTTNSKLDRLNMISTEFPDLIPFLKDGLLPEGSGEELRGKLSAFSERIQTLTNLSAEELAKTVVKGATPPPPATPTGSDSLFNQAKAALVGGNQVEYDRLMSEHYKQQKT